MLESIVKALRYTAFALLCLFMLSSCTTKLAYNFLDWATLWYIERYVSLDREQKAFAKEYLDEFHDWHRHTQLTRYADYLEGLKVRLNSGELSAEMVHSETDTVQVFVDDALAQLSPLFVELTATMSDKQVEELLDSIAEDRDEYRKDFVEVSEEQLHKKRIRELKSHLSLVLSGYTGAQKDAFMAWSKSLTPFEELALRQQEIWGQDLSQALEKRQDRKQLETTLRRLLFVHSDEWDPELERKIDVNQGLTYAMLAELFNTLEDNQRAKMNRKIDGFIKDFRELAAAKEEQESPPPNPSAS